MLDKMWFVGGGVAWIAFVTGMVAGDIGEMTKGPYMISWFDVVILFFIMFIPSIWLFIGGYLLGEGE